MSMYRRRHLERVLSAPVSRHKVRLLFGARQTGKTQLLRRLLAGPGTRLFDLQDSAERRRFEADPSSFGREVRALPPSVRAVAVDEIQKVPALLDEVQALFDSAPRRWQFYLTGSSARRLRTGSANLLPGRSHAYRLHPVCGWEVARGEASTEPAMPPPAGARQGGAGRLGPETDAGPPFFPAQRLDRVLRLGCLPGIRSEGVTTARATLAAYVGHYLEEEIRREALVREIGPFLSFLRVAALESGRQVNLARLSQESGVPASTLKSYYQVLVDTFVGHWIHPYAGRTRKRLLTSPRFHFFDVGVRNAAAEVGLEPRVSDELGGPLLEQWVAQELVARADYAGPGHRVSFWRTTYGVEVDLVWESPREDVPVEVKWTARPRPVDARHLETFLDEFPRRARRGLLVCRCPRPQRLTDRVTAIPWDAL
jgi:predicted AAA+ superfamily ATPase